jgi:hypothetical protein
MGKINFGRVLLGGLVAGLILNIGEYLLNDKVLAKEMAELFRRCGFPKPGTNFIVIAVVITFVLGIVIVFGYAAIRPRFGPGPKTAIIAGLLAWFASGLSERHCPGPGHGTHQRVRDRTRLGVGRVSPRHHDRCVAV